ncbi:cellulase N-terminal Ig-like domain-containing protein [Streptomyces sp. L7]
MPTRSLRPSTPRRGRSPSSSAGSADAWHFCMDDVSLLGGVPPEVYEPDTGPRVRVNQVAYLPGGPKNATLVTASAAVLPWELKSAAGAVVAHGRPCRVAPTWRPGRTCSPSTSARVQGARRGLHSGGGRRDEPALRHRDRRLSSGCGSTR